MGLSRLALFRTLGVVKEGPNLDEFTKHAYEQLELKIWQEQLENAPHGYEWHTSFHASSFPGGEEDRYCRRKVAYTLMNIPSQEPIKPQNRAIMEAGKALEHQIVLRWAKAGITIGGSCPIGNGHVAQTGFEVPELWFTGSSDAILDLRPKWESVLPVDVKGKDNEVVEKMKVGARSYDQDHYAQVQAYIWLCRTFHDQMGWSEMGLKPAEGGMIYYVSRQRPRNTHEFYLPYDEEFVAYGLARLQVMRVPFLQGWLPERPKEWRWTEPPCQWCDVKKLCKADYKAGVTLLSESNAVTFAQGLNPYYNFEKLRRDVLRRWDAEDERLEQNRPQNRFARKVA